MWQCMRTPGLDQSFLKGISGVHGWIFSTDQHMYQEYRIIVNVTNTNQTSFTLDCWEIQLQSPKCYMMKNYLLATLFSFLSTLIHHTLERNNEILTSSKWFVLLITHLHHHHHLLHCWSGSIATRTCLWQWEEPPLSASLGDYSS